MGCQSTTELFCKRTFLRFPLKQALKVGKMSAGRQDQIASPSPVGWQGSDSATWQLLHFLVSQVMFLVLLFFSSCAGGYVIK